MSNVNLQKIGWGLTIEFPPSLNKPAENVYFESETGCNNSAIQALDAGCKVIKFHYTILP